MKQLLFAILLLCQYIFISTEVKITITAKPNETEVQIKELEKTKEELLRKINGAIDDSVVALQKANDSESAKGLQYLTELKQHIKNINSEETHIEAGTQTSISIENMMSVYNVTDRTKTFRRKGKNLNKNDPDLRAKKKYIKMDVFGSKKDRKSQTTPTPEKQLKVEQDIEEWLAQKTLLEKAKIKKYKEQLRHRAMKRETCPNFGIGKIKKRFSSMRSRQKKRYSYPCCRKCCKHSYLGCL